MLTFSEFQTWLGTLQASEVQVEVYSPDVNDLYSIYSQIRIDHSCAVMEFGSGWSTAVIARAVHENSILWGGAYDELRHPNKWQVLTIDVSSNFQQIAINRIPELYKHVVHPLVSSCRMTEINGQICHVYDSIPPFTADFIYLDGPDADQVVGDVSGMHTRFGDESLLYGLPMSGDLIRLEPFFWPGTKIILDGRGANAVFLKNNFRRTWSYSFDFKLDQHCFVLQENAWGIYSQKLLEIKSLP